MQGYLRWGIDGIERFRGMFAIAIWDTRTKEMWLVRDRRGVKPLYWTARNGSVAFASEIKALLEDPRQRRTIDHTALYTIPVVPGHPEDADPVRGHPEASAGRPVTHL